jgi:hypothetical protein
MKLLVPFVLFMAVGFILAAGCVAVTKPINATPVSPASDPGLNRTLKAPDNSDSGSKGPLRVSISGISTPASLSVILDNVAVGTVNRSKPLDLMVSEGNHTVKVCMSTVCEQENVTTRFGKYKTVDFSEQLQKDVEFLSPTARILEYYRNGDAVSVTLEFINPESVDHTISVDLSVGYTYVDGRSHVKLGDSAQAKAALFVKAGQRETKQVDIALGSGGSIMSFGNPVVEDLKVK